MSQYDNTNTGALFINDRRQTENQPNAKGSVDIDGVEYWVSAWTKTSKSGQKFQSLAFTRKEQQQAPARPAQAKPAPTTPAFNPDVIDDDLPF